MVETTLQEFGGRIAGTLRIGVLPSLGSHWLAPRVADFVKIHPDVNVSVGTFDVDFSNAHKDPVTWDPSESDLVITWGKGGWRSLTYQKLAAEILVPVCSPKFLQDYTVNGQFDIWDVTRLGHKTRPDMWKTYSANIGTAKSIRMPKPGLVFDHFFMLLEAARAGAGVTLLPSLIVSSDLSENRLVKCAETVKSDAFYAIVASDSAWRRPIVSAFANWIKAQDTEPMI
ncbi:MAG: LysR substrate-binding domain-containing protein [Rhizobiaceae bacterium]